VRRDESRRASVIVTGPLPPPANGMTVITESLLQSNLVEDFALHHLDISDHRNISNVDRFEARNVYLALLHGLVFLIALLRFRPDIVHVQVARNRLGFLRDALFLLPSRLARRTVVLHLNAREFDQFYAHETWWMRFLIRLAIGPRWYAAVVSSRFRGTFARFLDPRRVFVIPNGTPDIGAGQGAGTREPVVLHLSTMWRLKGTFDVIEAARRVSARMPAVKFVLAGGWFRDDERADALDEVQRLGLGDVIEFVGPVFGPAKVDLFRRAAVFALPTRYPTEAQPVAILEALAAGTPVVATPVGAIPDMVRDGVEGFLVPEGDHDRLAASLLDVLVDADLRERMGRAARARYEAEYTMDVFADRVRRLWRSILDERTAQRRVPVRARVRSRRDVLEFVRDHKGRA
jgi:glycosyltransferase involved in cell wall biosynthesis